MWKLLRIEPGKHAPIASSPRSTLRAKSRSVVQPVAIPTLSGLGHFVGPRGRVQGDTYVVGACDTVTGISRRLNLDWHALLAANPQIANPNRIYIGQVLALPR
jgi:LysM repeat protein